MGALKENIPVRERKKRKKPSRFTISVMGCHLSCFYLRSCSRIILPGITGYISPFIIRNKTHYSISTFIEMLHNFFFNRLYIRRGLLGGTFKTLNLPFNATLSSIADLNYVIKSQNKNMRFWTVFHHRCTNGYLLMVVLLVSSSLLRIIIPCELSPGTNLP